MRTKDKPWLSGVSLIVIMVSFIWRGCLDASRGTCVGVLVGRRSSGAKMGILVTNLLTVPEIILPDTIAAE